MHRSLFAGLAVGAALMGAKSPATRRYAEPSVLASIDSVATPAAPGSAEPNLAVGADGRVYLSWLEPANPGHALRFAILDGARWTSPRTIASATDFFVNWADFPSIEVLGNRRLAAHWLQRSGQGTYAHGVRIAQSGDDGATWSTPVVPHRDDAPAEHGFVAMWSEPGGVGAVWLDGRKFKQSGHDAGNEMMLVSTSIASNGVRAAEMRLDERTCDCCQNAAALTSNGPIVAYRNRSADEIRDVYVTRRVGGKWRTGVPVHADNWKIAACPVNGPGIAARGAQVALAWFTAPGDSGRVQVAFSNDAGGSFGTPVRVDAGSPSGRVDVALLADGAALVTWVERLGGEVTAVRARRVMRNGVAGAPVTIASSTAARASGFPRAVVSGTQVYFAWTVPGKPSAVRMARTALAEFR